MSFYPSEKSKGLNGLNDTSIVTPKEYDILMHDGTEWENSDILKEQRVAPSKNLLPNNGMYTVHHGLTFDFNPTGYPKGTVKVTGTKDDTGAHAIDMGITFAQRVFTLATGTYKIIDGTPVEDDSIGLAIYNCVTGDLIKRIWNSSDTFTLNATTQCFCNIEYRGSTDRVFNTVIYPMITTDLDATVDDYEPYYNTLKNDKLSINDHKKYGAYNLLPIWLYRSTVYEHGITWTINADGSVVANGTKDTTGEAFVLFSRSLGYTVPAGDYVFTAKNRSGKTRAQLLALRGNQVVTLADLDYGTTTSIVHIQNGDALQVSLIVKANETVSNDVFLPMLTADLTAGYESFVTPAKTNRQLTEFTQGLDNLLLSPNTNDAMASSVASTRTAVFSGNGSSYTGTLPNGNYRYGIFISIPRNVTGRVLLAFAPGQGIAMNYYTGSTWDGWHSINIDS